MPCVTQPRLGMVAGTAPCQDLLGQMGCGFAHVLLTPLLQEQIQRYFILCTFV